MQSNMPSYTPMNQGTICAKVYPEGIQPIMGNNCGLIPMSENVILSVRILYTLPLDKWIRHFRHCKTTFW